MAKKKHKSASEVTIAPLVEPSPLETWVGRFWKPAALVAVAVTAVILIMQSRQAGAQADREEGWNRLASLVSPNPQTGQPEGDPGAIAAAADELAAQAAGPWIRLVEALNRQGQRDLEGAIGALQRIEADFPEHALVAERYAFEEEGVPLSIVAHHIAALRAQVVWESEHPEVFRNPPVPEGAPRVRLETSKGSITVGLYADEAPGHVENFLTLVGQGYYDGLKFHRVVHDQLVQAGDPNTREGERATWGQGGPEHTVPPEANSLKHFAGVLAAAKKPGERESSGSQFYFATGDLHHLNGDHVVFGAVLEGMDVVLSIGEGATGESSDQPLDPVEIQSATMLRLEGAPEPPPEAPVEEPGESD